MTGIRIVKQMSHLIFEVKDRVRSASGRSGRIIRINRHTEEVQVLWDDGEEFWIKPRHLSHEDRPFGGEDDRAPSPVRTPRSGT